MKKILKYFVITIFALWFANRIIAGFSVSDNIYSYLFIAFLFVIANYFIKPILKIIFLPINVITLGLSQFFINAIILFGIDYVSNEMSVSSWTFSGFSYQSFSLNETTFGILATYIITAFVIYSIIAFLKWL